MESKSKVVSVCWGKTVPSQQAISLSLSTQDENYIPCPDQAINLNTNVDIDADVGSNKSLEFEDKIKGSKSENENKNFASLSSKRTEPNESADASEIVFKNRTSNQNDLRKTQLWYCCPFCRSVYLVHEKRKNLRVFATQDGLISHVKSCHPDKQEEKIEVLQLQQSNTISMSNNLKKPCFTKSVTKLKLNTPLDEKSQSSSTLRSLNPLNRELNCKLNVMSPAASSCRGYGKTSTMIHTTPTKSARLSEPLIVIKEKQKSSLVSSTFVKGDKSAENQTILRFPIPIFDPLMISSPQSGTPDVFRSRDTDLSMEKIIVKRKPMIRTVGVKDISANKSFPDLQVTKEDNDNSNGSYIDVGVDDLNRDADGQKSVELIDLTLESESDMNSDSYTKSDTETDSNLDSDFEADFLSEVVAESDETQSVIINHRNQHPSGIKHIRKSFSPLLSQIKGTTPPTGIDLDVTIRNRTETQQQPQIGHASSAIHVLVPDYAEEIEFEMGEHQSDSYNCSISDDSKKSRKSDCVHDSNSSSHCGCGNSEDLLCYPDPLGLDECTVDVLYNQMYKMFPRLYDWDQLMAIQEQD